MYKIQKIYYDVLKNICNIFFFLENKTNNAKFKIKKKINKLQKTRRNLKNFFFIQNL